MQHIIGVKKSLLIVNKYLFDSIFYNLLNQLYFSPRALFLKTIHSQNLKLKYFSFEKLQVYIYSNKYRKLTIPI